MIVRPIEALSDAAVYRAAEDRFEITEEEHDIALGIMEGMSFTEHEITLEPGDKVYLYTDGIPEANDKNEAMYGLERLTGCLNDNCAR